MRNKTILFLSAAIIMAAGFVMSCSKDNDNDTPVTPPAQEDALDLKLVGWTWGSNKYAPYIPSDGDSLTIFATNTANTRCILVYASPTWGVATLVDVNVEKNDTAYIFSKPITATIREDHSAWDFSAKTDTIYMPNRNPSTDEITVKPYPVVLTSGYMTIEKPRRWQFDFEAYLVPKSEHTMSVSFRSGKIPAMK